MTTNNKNFKVKNGLDVAGNFTAQNTSSSIVAAKITGASGQSANLLEVVNSSGTKYFSVDSIGRVSLDPSAVGIYTPGAWHTSGSGVSAIKFLDTTSEISTANGANIPLTVSQKQAGGATADLTRWVNNGSTLAKIDVSGNLTAASFIKTSGTSSQFLKADGSVDSTAYAALSGATFTGDITATKLNVPTVGGDEGGEIYLGPAATNTTLAGGITIDVYQNKLRFFEQGGSARGAYIDISAAGTGVSTNLLSGGSASNSFTTISTPSGTSPVADSSADTLTLLAGTGITITGDSSADSITIASTITDTNTTYTFASGTTNGAFSVTPSGGGAQSISIYGLGSAAYTSSSSYATSAFTTIATTSGTSPVASTTSDTLTLTAGNGISITGNSSTDTVTFANTGYYSGGTDVPLADGGTNASLTASNGGIVYSTASAMAILSGTATAGQILQSGASGAPSWSTATYPSTAPGGSVIRSDGTNWVASTVTYPASVTVNQILWASSANQINGLTTASNQVLVTGATGIPAFSATLPSGVTASSLTSFGSSPTLTTPTINTINVSASSTAAALWNTTLTTGSISMGGALTSGGITVAGGTTYAGTIAIANASTSAHTISISNGAGTANKTINIGTSSTGGTTAIALGSSSGATSTIALNGTVTVTGAAAFNGGFSVDTTAFSVADATGNTSIAGTLSVTGALTASPAAATTTTGASGVGYMGMPQNASTTTNPYRLVAADAGTHIYSTVTRTINVPGNASGGTPQVAFPVGATVVFVNASGATLTIQMDATTTDTCLLAGLGTSMTGGSGTRTLAPFGMATLLKITSTQWIISGNGLS